MQSSSKGDTPRSGVPGEGQSSQRTKRTGAEKPRSPERPPTKRQRRHFEESTGSKAEDEVAEAEVAVDLSLSWTVGPKRVQGERKMKKLSGEQLR